MEGVYIPPNVADFCNNVEGEFLCIGNLMNWQRRALLSCVTTMAHQFPKRNGHDSNIWTGRAVAIPTLPRLHLPLARWNVTASGITAKPTRTACGRRTWNYVPRWCSGPGM